MGSRYESNGRPELVDGSGSSKASMILQVVAESGRDEMNSKIHRPLLAETLTSSLSSSSSTDSSSGDFFQVDTVKLMSRTGPVVPPKLDVNASLITRDDENDVPSFSTVGTSFSHVSDITYEPLVPTFSPIQSPPTPQVMDRSINYDPCRIPASVFSSKPATPLEWSLASNESLFSIHVGNTSFSRDHFIMKGGDMHKSREMTKSGEMKVFNQIPPPKITEINWKNDDKGNFFDIVREADGLTKDVHKKKADDQSKKKIVPQEVVSSVCSGTTKETDGNGSNGSKICSSECPKKKKCAWPFRCCSNCSCTFCAFRPFRCCSNRSWGFCSCKWPKCSCKWPKCLCTWPRCLCTWPTCSCTAPCHYCSNCSCSFCCCIRPRCNCSWPSCHCCSCSQSLCHCCNCSQPFCQCFSCSKTCSNCCNCSQSFRNCCNCSQAFRNCSQAFRNCWSCSRKILCCFPCTMCGNGGKSGSKEDFGSNKHQHKQRHACKWMSCNRFKCCSCPRCSCCC